MNEAEIKQKNLNDFIEHTKQTLAEINEDHRKMYKNIVNMGYNYLKNLYKIGVDKDEIYNFLIRYKEELDTGIAKEYIEDLIKIVIGDCEESKVLWK